MANTNSITLPPDESSPDLQKFIETADFPGGLDDDEEIA